MPVPGRERTLLLFELLAEARLWSKFEDSSNRCARRSGGHIGELNRRDAALGLRRGRYFQPFFKLPVQLRLQFPFLLRREERSGVQHAVNAAGVNAEGKSQEGKGSG
jgi:hypothetical protein